MKSTFFGPAIISAVVTRFFWPPLMPLIMALPTCMRWLFTGCSMGAASAQEALGAAVLPWPSRQALLQPLFRCGSRQSSVQQGAPECQRRR